MKSLKNKYFLLRHGRNIHQTDKKEICYGWPDDNPPCSIDEVGRQQAEEAAGILEKLDIDLIFSSDTLRVKQTVQIVAEENSVQVFFDERLRDLNWGIFACGPKKEALAYYDDKERFNDAPPKGESWGDLQRRALEVIFEIEDKYSGKNIVIASHGDTLFMIEAWFNDWKSEEELALNRKNALMPGEVRALN